MKVKDIITSLPDVYQRAIDNAPQYEKYVKNAILEGYTDRCYECFDVVLWSQSQFLLCAIKILSNHESIFGCNNKLL